MKKLIVLMVLGLALAFSGCASIDKALRYTQEIQGTGSVTIETAVNMTTASVENARQEGGQFKADRLDIVHKGKWTGTRIEIHATPYGRALVE